MAMQCALVSVNGARVELADGRALMFGRGPESRISDKKFSRHQATKRPCSPEKVISDEDEQTSSEEKLKQLQAFAERESDKNMDSTTIKPSAPSSTCSQSHWKQIGSLMLFTAAGVPESSKVAGFDIDGCIITTKALSQIAHFMWTFGLVDLN